MQIIDPTEVFPPILLGSNLGGGNAIFAGKSGQTLQFNTLAEGNGITMTFLAGVWTLSVDEADLNYPDELSDLMDANTTGVVDLDRLQYIGASTEFQPRSQRELLRSDALGTVITNNATVVVVTLDKLISQSALVYYTLYRKTDTDPEAVRSGFLFCTYFTDSDTWSLSDVLRDFDNTDQIGVTWAVNAASGAVSYTSSDYAGANPESNLKWAFVADLPI